MKISKVVTMILDDTSWNLTVLHTNDSHGHIFPINITPPNISSQYRLCHNSVFHNLGGFSHLATIINNIRVTNENVLLFDSGDVMGDTMISNKTKGELQIEIMNKLKYDAMSPGNHDIDYGIDKLKSLSNKASFPMLAANLIDNKTNRPYLGNPYVIKDINGVKIGIYGLTYHLTPETTSKKNIKGVKYTLDFKKISKDIEEIKNVGTDFIIILSHLGTKVDEKLAQEIPNIDLILGGHSHDNIPIRKLNNVIISQSTPYYTGLGYLKLTFNNKKLVSYSGKTIPIQPKKINHNYSIKNKIIKVYNTFKHELKKPIGFTITPIIRNYKEESPSETLFGNILRNITRAQISLLPGRGFGVTIPRGLITMDMLTNLLPHNSNIYTLYLKGEDLVALLKQSILNQINPDVTKRVGGLIQTTGLSFLYSYHHNIVRDVKVLGVPIEKNKYYSVVTNQLIYEGGHKYKSMKNAININKLPFTSIELISNWINLNSPIYSFKEGWSYPLYKKDKEYITKKCLF